MTASSEISPRILLLKSKILPLIVDHCQILCILIRGYFAAHWQFISNHEEIRQILLVLRIFWIVSRNHRVSKLII